jgi:hypothetical protein
VWWNGTVRCRARVCPVCFIGRRAALGAEIAHVCEAWHAQYRVPLMLATLTIRHQAHHPVSIVRGVRAAWRKHLQGRAWQQYKRSRGIELIAAEEVTHGENGWHPHMHVLLLPKTPQSTDLYVADRAAWHDRWCRTVTRVLGADFVPDQRHGTDLRPCRMTQYLSKLGIELTDSGAIKARSPFRMLKNGDVDKYLELQLSRKRARDVTWSRGLRPYRDTLPPRPIPNVLWQPAAYEFERAAEHGTLLATIEAAESGGKDAARTALWSTTTEGQP